MNTDKYVMTSVKFLSLELKDLSQQWKELIIQLKFKKNNKTYNIIYWGMSSLAAENMLSCFLLPSLTPYVEKIIRTFLNLFRRDRSATDYARCSNLNIENNSNTIRQLIACL
jgi:curved DNA-binding protein CbpA